MGILGGPSPANWVTWLVLAAAGLGAFSEAYKRNLYVGGLLPSAVPSKWRLRERIAPAIHHAIQDVNRNATVLPNYVLTITTAEAECNKKEGLQTYLDLVDILPRKLMVLTDLCTELTSTIDAATQISLSRVPQISYGNSDSVFDDNYEQPNLFRILPSESQFNEARLALLREFGWLKALGTLYQTSPTYVLPHNRQLVSLFTEEIPVAESVPLEKNGSSLAEQLRVLVNKEVRVVLGNFNETWARRVFCQAYKVQMYGENYRWVLAGAYDTQWWKVDDTECFPHELERALQGVIRIDLLPTTTAENPEKKASALRHTYKLVTNSKLHGYIYDGIWAAALALNNISHFYNEVEGNSDPQTQIPMEAILSNSSYTYGNPKWEEALRRALRATSFLGVTGRVRFEKQGRRGHSLLIKQFQATPSGYEEVSVGEFDSDSKRLDLTKYSSRVLRSHDEFLRFEKEYELMDPTHFQTNDDHAGPSVLPSCSSTVPTTNFMPLILIVTLGAGRRALLGLLQRLAPFLAN